MHKLIDCGIQVTGAVMLSPSPRASVCHAGGNVKVTCITPNSSLQQWKLTLMGMADPEHDISVSSNTIAVHRRRIDSSRVTVLRISAREAAPLISTLEISSVSRSLNGTLNITCMELGSNTLMATTTVFIAGNIQGRLANNNVWLNSIYTGV